MHACVRGRVWRDEWMGYGTRGLGVAHVPFVVETDALIRQCGGGKCV